MKQVAIWTGYYGASLWDHKQNDYTYDAVGQRLTDVGVHEGYRVYTAVWSPMTTDSFSETVSQSASYDALGRLGGIVMTGTTYLPDASTQYKYDAVGNVRRTLATHRILNAAGQGSGSGTTEDYWFRYDALNRVVLDKGKLSGAAGASGTAIVRPAYYGPGNSGVGIVYDAAGQRIATTTLSWTPPSVTGYWDYYAGFVVTGYTPGYTQELRENYDYDGAGRVTAIRLTQGAAVDDGIDPVTGLSLPATAVPAAAASGGITRSVFGYDLVGRQLTQSDYDEAGSGVVYGRSSSFDAAGKLTWDSATTVRPDATYVTTSTYGYTSGSGEYLLGAVASMSGATYRNGAYQNTATTTNTYEWWGGAVQGTIAYVQGSSTFTTTLYYDGLGTIAFARIMDGRPRQVFYRANTEGQVIHRGEEDWASGGDPHETWYRFGGREWGYASNNGTWKLNETGSITDRTAGGGSGAFRNGSSYSTPYSEFSQGYDPVNSYNQGSAAGAYTVPRTGETLRGIAQGLWGDASLWYKLAEANGLSAEASLVEGQRLTVPAGVTRSTYNVGTVKPYDPAAALGNVSPTTPAPPKKKNCGFAQIFLAIIAVAVTIATAGALIAAVAPVTGTTATGLLAGMQAFLGIGGASVAGASAGLVMVGAGVVGGAVGSMVSQGLGIAMGVQDKFSWAGVALAAIGGGVGGAIGPGGALGGSNGLFSGIGSNVAAAGLRAAVGNAVTQGIGVAAGLQDRFSFAGVAAAAVGGAAGRWAGGGRSDFGSSALSAGATLLANAATRSAIEGSNFGDNVLAALPDTIGSLVGNALGRAGVKAIEKSRETTAQRLKREGFELVGQFADSGAIRTDGPSPAEQALAENGDIVVTATRDQINQAKGLGWKIADALGFHQGGLFYRIFSGTDKKRPSNGNIVVTYAQPGVRTGQGYDIMGQPLNGASNYNSGRQFSNIISDAGNVSFGTTLKRLGQWGVYTVPDAAAINAKIFDPYRGLTSQGRTAAMQMDRLTGGTISSVATGVSVELGADQRTQDLFYGLGSSMDGFLIAGGSMAGARVPGIGNQRELSIVNGENGVHGNSRLSGRTTWLYELQTLDGQFLKYGISVNPNTRYSSSFMSDKRIGRIASGTRADMLALERQMVTANPGPLNQEPWAIKAREGK